jgi:hypothetical protein
MNTITIIDATIGSGTYAGGGTIAIVPQVNIETKQYNFFVNQGVNFSINKVDFLVEKTERPLDGSPAGQYLVNVFPSTGDEPGNVSAIYFKTTPYDPTYYPYENAQDLLWHSLYPQVSGSYIQFRIFWNAEQMINPLTS